MYSFGGDLFLVVNWWFQEYISAIYISKELLIFLKALLLKFVQDNGSIKNKR